MENKKERKISLPNASKIRSLVSQEIILILEKHKKISYNILKLTLVQKYGVTDKTILEFLEMFQNTGIIKYTEDSVELIQNDVLRKEPDAEVEDDRALADNGDTVDKEGEI